MDVGSIVRIVDPGQRYVGYQDFSDRFCGGENISRGVLRIGDCCTVECKAPKYFNNPEITDQEILFAVRRLVDNRLFLMGERGITQAHIKDVIDFIERGNQRSQYNESWSTIYRGWE